MLAETEDPQTFQVFMLLSSLLIVISEIQITVQSVKRLVFIECMKIGCRLS